MTIAKLGEEEVHVMLNSLQVAEHVSTLLSEYARHAIEEAALETQRDGCTRLQDLSACFLYINLLNGFSGDFLGTRLVANSCHEPVSS